MPSNETPRPEIEVGDWVLVDNRDFGDILIARRAGELPSHREWYYKAEDICEIRKADGRIWRRQR